MTKGSYLARRQTLTITHIVQNVVAARLEQMYQGGFSYIFTNILQMPPREFALVLHEKFNGTDRDKWREELRELCFPEVMNTAMLIDAVKTDFLAQVLEALTPEHAEGS
jgi:hypothetical protein